MFRRLNSKNKKQQTSISFDNINYNAEKECAELKPFVMESGNTNLGVASSKYWAQPRQSVGNNDSNIDGGDDNGDVTTNMYIKKIVELEKQLEQANIYCEIYRQKNLKLEDKVMELSEINKQLNDNIKKTNASVDEYTKIVDQLLSNTS